MTEKVLLGETLRGAKAEVDLQELVTGRTLLSCVTRYGKSWLARRLCEQLFGKVCIGIIDGEGEYSTLLEKFQFLIIGRDVPIEPEAAAYLADEILKNKLSFIIDGSNPDLDAATYQEFISNFVNRFIAIEAIPKIPYLFVIEEAKDLIPEKGLGTSLCAEPLTRLISKGGKRGIGALVITQRPAFVTKMAISQCVYKMIGRTEWEKDIDVLRKFAEIPESADIKHLKQGYFYVKGDERFIPKPEVVHIGPVSTTHLGATPSVIPPTPTELKEVVAKIAANLPVVIEKMKQTIPNVSEIEARVTEKIDAKYKVRLEKEKKEKERIKVRTETPLLAEIADLNRKLEDATRHAAMAGPVTDILEHPLVKKNLEKLNDKQRGLVELLERRGPQEAKSLSLFIERPPAKVPQFVWEVNSRIKGLIAREGDRYVSKLVDLFPVTEEAKAQVDLREKLELTVKALDNTQRVLADERIKHRDELELVRSDIKQHIKERDELQQRVVDISKELNEYSKLKAELEEESMQKPIDLTPTHDLPPPAIPKEAPPAQQPYVGVDATLRRKLTSFEVHVSTEKLDVDEGSWTGKILARGVKGFFSEEKGFGQIMAEMERVYSATRTSGGTRKAVQESLDELCAKGILEREQKAGQWMYRQSEEFKERVRKA